MKRDFIRIYGDSELVIRQNAFFLQCWGRLVDGFWEHPHMTALLCWWVNCQKRCKFCEGFCVFKWFERVGVCWCANNLYLKEKHYQLIFIYSFTYTEIKLLIYSSLCFAWAPTARWPAPECFIIDKKTCRHACWFICWPISTGQCDALENDCIEWFGTL